MKRFWLMTEILHFRVRHLDSLGIAIRIQKGAHFKPSVRWSQKTGQYV